MKKVQDLTSASRRVDIRLRILSVESHREVRTARGRARVATVLAGDETGTIKLSLWNDDIELAEEGCVVEIHNGYVKTFRGEKELSPGLYGEIVRVEDPNFPSREEILASEEKESAVEE